MALNIKNAEVERLAAKVAKALGVSKTEALRVSLAAKDQELDQEFVRKRADFRKFMEENVWSKVPVGLLGTSISKDEEEEILGYGTHGV